MRLLGTASAVIAIITIFPSYSPGAEPLRALSKTDFDVIDSYVESQLKEANIPGAALVIVEGKQVVHMRGYGVAGPDGRPTTVDTTFVLGSISKSFTALAIMQLVETGKIDLDAPVQKYLSWFRVADPQASATMKVRQLLNHTSGMSTYAGRTHFSSRDVSDEALERRVRALRTARLTDPVGYYSNANYSTLGAIIEAVSGQRYEDYIRQNIFDPLGMVNSHTSVETAKQHSHATGYRYWFGKPIAATDIPYSRGAGGRAL